MFKKIIAPVQAWLLSQGKCVGCGKLLEDGKKSKNSSGEEKIICQCGRIYVRDIKTGNSRRALFDEV